MPTQTNEYGYDPWGLNVDVARQALVITTLLYRYWFRVAASGIEHIPDGRVLVISNHAGQVALDAAMIGTATVLEREPPRIVRGMGEYWLPTVPFVNLLMSRTGSVVGTPKNCTDLLSREEAVIAFPEGVRGMNKLFSERYRLQHFGSGFMRLALATRTPIVPVAVIGSEEQAPAIANLAGLGRLLGMPSFPITLTWPWLGPLGLLPLPTKYRIYFGKPMRFEGDPDDEDAVIDRKVQKVVDTIQGMIDRGLSERQGIFF
ncbi:acyltransferase family protein [bacterium]|nr:acyltransferase family protein [bacterium]